MTAETMALRAMLEKGADADVLRETIGFATERLALDRLVYRRFGPASDGLDRDPSARAWMKRIIVPCSTTEVRGPPA